MYANSSLREQHRSTNFVPGREQLLPYGPHHVLNVAPEFLPIHPSGQHRPAVDQPVQQIVSDTFCKI